MSVPTLRWLQIRRYEQFEAVRIEFSGQENLVLGNNGAGKTSLLKLIRAVLSLDFGELRDRLFDVEFELETVRARDVNEAVVIQGQVRNEVAVQPEMPTDYPGSMSGRGHALFATLRLLSKAVKVVYELQDDRMTLHDDPVALTETVPYQGEGRLLPGLPRVVDNKVLIRRILELFPVCESAFVGEADQEFKVLTEEVQYACSVAEDRKIFLDPPERLGRLLYRDFFPVLMRVLGVMDRDSGSAGIAPFPIGGRPDFERSATEYLGLLEQVQSAIGAVGFLLVPKIIREKGDLLECRGIGIRVRFADGSEVVESELTFGQRRYLHASLMLLSHPRTPFLIDEIDNGLHPRLIETLLKLLHGRQFFVASHNKIVIDYTNFDGPEDVQKKIHIVERHKDGRQSVVTLDDETARGVYEKISVAIQSPSDVLLAEGLW